MDKFFLKGIVCKDALEIGLSRMSKDVARTSWLTVRQYYLSFECAKFCLHHATG